MTALEWYAREQFAAISRQPPSRWSIVDRAEPGTWLDFFDPLTGKHGQCCMGADGRWKQDPRGKRPVLLRYKGVRR